MIANDVGIVSRSTDFDQQWGFAGNGKCSSTCSEPKVISNKLRRWNPPLPPLPETIVGSSFKYHFHYLDAFPIVMKTRWFPLPSAVGMTLYLVPTMNRSEVVRAAVWPLPGWRPPRAAQKPTRCPDKGCVEWTPLGTRRAMPLISNGGERSPRDTPHPGISQRGRCGSRCITARIVLRDPGAPPRGRCCWIQV